MGKKDQVIQLIQSLTATDKRNFKLLAGIQPGDKNYLTLFDELDSKEEYDVKALCKSLNISAKQLADDKYYLNQALIKSLLIYDDQQSIAGQVRRTRDEASVLSGRGLNEHALQAADKALQKVQELELWEHYDALLIQKIQIYINSARYEEAAAVAAEHKRVSKILDEVFCLTGLFTKALAYSKSGNQKAAFKKLVQHPKLKASPDKLLSIRAQVAWFTTWNHYYMRGEINHEKARSLVIAEIKFYGKRPAIQNVNAVGYLVSYTRLADIEGALGNYTAGLKALERLKPLLKVSSSITATRINRLRAYVDVASLAFLYWLDRYSEVISLYKKIESQLPQRPLAEQVHAAFYCAASCFQLKKYDEAISGLDHLLKEKEDVSIDVKMIVRPLLIMLHMDMNNYSLVPYIIKSAKLWMKRVKIETKEVELFNSYAYSIAMAPEFKRAALFIKLKAEVDRGNMKSINKDLKLDTWLATKIAKRTRQN